VWTAGTSFSRGYTRAPMLASTRRLRSLLAPTLIAAFSFATALPGCGPSDPLEAIRQLQDEKHDYKGSLEPLRKLLEDRPNDSEVLYRYGAALAGSGAAGLAVWPFRRSMESPEWREKAAVPLAAVLIATGAYDGAIEVLNTILEGKPDDIRALLLRAHARMLTRRDYEGALADANHVIELDPENKDALTPRAVALLGLGRAEEAGPVVDQLESLYRDDSVGLHGSPGLCIARAIFAKEKGEPKVAEERFDACLEQFPSDAPVVTGAMEFFDDQGNHERANEILKKALELVPESYSYRSTLSLRLLAQGHAEDAEAVLRGGVDLPSQADKAQVWAGIASFNLEQGDLGDAIEAFEKARALEPSESAQLLLGHADALISAGRLDEALVLIDQIKLPAHQAVLRGRIELARGNPAAAQRLFDEGMSEWPNSAVARYYAALAAEQLGDFAGAIEEYRYAMRIDVRETDAYLRLAQLQAASGHVEEAIETLNFSPGGRPDELGAGLLEARLLARAGRPQALPIYFQQMLAQPEFWGKVIAAFGAGTRDRSGPEAALASMQKAKPLLLDDPVHIDVLAAFVDDFAAIGKASKGVALVETALRKHPDSAPLQAVAGRAFALSGARDRARGAFERALELEPENSRALLGLARLNAEAGDRERAVELYARAITRDPKEREGAREHAALLAAMGRHEDAEKVLGRVLEDYPYDADAARALAALRLGRGVKDGRTLELARRAVRFGGGREAEVLFEQVKSDSPDAAATRGEQGAS
jgi:tetratricopeptide (TPR) repeat protein